MSNGEQSSVRDELHALALYVTRLATAFWGPKEDNGVQSIVRQLVTRVTTMEERFRHYLDTEREDTCHGLAALAAHEAACEDQTVAQSEAATRIKVANRQALALVIGSVLTFASIIIVALLK